MDIVDQLELWAANTEDKQGEKLAANAAYEIKRLRKILASQARELSKH